MRLRALGLFVMLASQTGCADDHFAEPHLRTEATTVFTDAEPGGSRRDASSDPGTHDGGMASADAVRDGSSEVDASDVAALDAAGPLDSGVQEMPAADAQEPDGAAATSADAQGPDGHATTPADAQPDDAEHAAKPCQGCLYAACMVSTASSFRFAIFARSASSDRCYRLTFVYIANPVPGLPFPEVTLSDGWAIEPAIIGEREAECRTMAANWSLGGVGQGNYSTQIRGHIEIVRNPLQRSFVNRVSGELSLAFETDAGTHATQLRFEDLEVGQEKCAAP